MSAVAERPVLAICALVAYDGTDYAGFQYQLGVATIQGVLEEALLATVGAPVRVAGSGRTDAGVHARGQVIAARVPWRHTPGDLQRAWNARLPKSVAVRKVQLAPLGFHPRFSALDRTYRYTVYEASDAGSRNTPGHSPLTDRFALHVTKRLDLIAMNEAAATLIGNHDFASFGQPPTGESSVRTLHQAEWQEVTTNLSPPDPYPGRCLVFTICANAFLYQMVRNLVGTLLQVGLGYRQPTEVSLALAAKDRSRSAPPVSPCGLMLERIRYPASLGLHFDEH
jgi:tRNA pseudouridine38-40 synthase